MHRVSRLTLVALALFALIIGFGGSSLAGGHTAPLAFDETPGGMMTADLSQIPGTYEVAQSDRRSRGVRNCNNLYNQCVTQCNINPNADPSVKAYCLTVCNSNRAQCVRQVEKATD